MHVSVQKNCVDGNWMRKGVHLGVLTLSRSILAHGPIQNAKISALVPNGSIKPSRRCIVLDIEGTTTPISFVTDVLFPYGHNNVGKHLDATYDSSETQHDIKLLRAQVSKLTEKIAL